MGEGVKIVKKVIIQKKSILSAYVPKKNLITPWCDITKNMKTAIS